MKRVFFKDKAWLENEYITLKKSIIKIASDINCSHSTIGNYLKKYNIETRPTGAAIITEEIKERLARIRHPTPMLNKNHSKETIELMSKNRKGSGNSNWKGGITLVIRNFRKTKRYQEWRKSVLIRDEFKCKYQDCNKETTIAHHIKTLNSNPELALDINNGMAICLNHHKEIHRKLVKNAK